MRRLTLGLCFLFFFRLGAAQEPLRRPSLDAVFVDTALELETFDDQMWLPDGDHLIYWTSRHDEQHLWRFNVESGAHELLADWTAVLRGLTEQRPDWVTPGPGDVNNAASRRTTPVLSPDGRFLVGGHAGDLFLFEIATGEARFLTADPAPEIFPSFSPDGSKIAFVRNGDLYWIDREHGVVHQVTNRGSDSKLLNGVADWVYEEELDVERCYWWSPDGARLAFLQFDEHPVGIVPITDDAMPYPNLERQLYPKAGTANPIVHLAVVAIEGGDPMLMHTGDDDNYLPRAGWTPSGEVWVQRLNRDQTVLDLLIADPHDGSTKTLVTERDSAWINIRNDLRFLSDGRFLWTSERDGWRHLYIYRPDGTLERRLTSGEWQIERVMGCDADETHAFVTATGTNRRQQMNYRIDLTTGERVPLGEAHRGVHHGELGPGGELLVDLWSTLDDPPRADLVSTDGPVVHRIWDSGEELTGWDLLPIEPGAITADDGTVLDSLLMRPRDFDPTTRYPVVLYVYGGPHSQLTADRWGGSIHHTYRIFAEMGIATFLIDNRGTWGRGHAFETVVHRRLGEVEVADQLAAVRWLRTQTWVDDDRIAVYGGSYGGYMTLLLMLRAPEVFRAGIAYAPVTDWTLYDTVYAERYMDTPQDNPEGYAASAPLTYAENLTGPLLLVHGSMDNNVHLQNSLQLVGRLAAADKTFELMIYPRTRHMVRLSQFAPQFHRLKVDFLRRNLLEKSEE